MRLGIDYGTVVTRAVLAWPDGRYTQLLVDGTAQLPSAVYVDTDAALWAGPAAQRRAETDPAGLVPHPKRHIADGTVAVRGQPVQVVDLIAATLRRVGEQATQVAGQPVSDVTLTVPAGWGPARRTVLRRAATRAGLAQPHLLEAPAGSKPPSWPAPAAGSRLSPPSTPPTPPAWPSTPSWPGTSPPSPPPSPPPQRTPPTPVRRAGPTGWTAGWARCTPRSRPWRPIRPWRYPPDQGRRWWSTGPPYAP